MAAGLPLPGLGAPMAPGPMPMPQAGLPMAMPGQPMPGMMPPGMPVPGAMPPPPADPVIVPEIPEEEWPALYSELKAKYRDDRDHIGDWYDEARKDFDFVAGRQWDEQTERVLKSQMRPASTFNTVAAMIEAVAGYEVANRQEPRYIQRNMGAAGVSELTTAGAKYFRDNAHAEHEESAAFKDAVTCGLGCTEALIDYDDNEDGDYVKRRVSIFEMVPDSSARADNLADAKRVFRARRMSVSDARDMFPEVENPRDLHAGWADDDLGGTVIHDERPDPYEAGEDEYPDTRDIVVVEAQWWEYVPYMRFMDPMTGQMRRLPKQLFETLSERMLALGMPPLRAAMTRKKVFYRAFLGNRILDVTETPVQGHFTYQFISCKRDETKGTFYGMVRSLRDPQQFLNKLISNITHILNTNAKGGIMAELDAFEDNRKAAENWAKPDSIVWTRPGAIQAGKIQPKPVAQINPAFFQLVDFAMGMGPRTTGLNAEFLGMQQQDQAGVLEYQRRQSSVTILAGAFDNLKLYRERDGAYTLRLMQEYLSDGRLIRIVGEEGSRFLPLNRDATVGEYEVIVDDAPTSPNMKEQQWATIQAMLPILQPMVGGNPEAVAELMKDAPLAESRKAKLYEILMRKDPQAEAMKNEQMQAQRASAYADINKKDAASEKDRAAALKTFAETVTAFTQVPPALEGPFPVGPMPPQVPPMVPGMPQGGPPMAPQVPQMPAGVPRAAMARPGMPMQQPGAPVAPVAVPGAPGGPVPVPPGLRAPGA
jgi:hypothetical protein